MTTFVLSPALVSVAEPVWFEPPIACNGTTMVPGGGGGGGAAADAAIDSRRGAAPNAMAKSTIAMVDRFMDTSRVRLCTPHLPRDGSDYNPRACARSAVGEL